MAPSKHWRQILGFVMLKDVFVFGVIFKADVHARLCIKQVLFSVINSKRSSHKKTSSWRHMFSSNSRSVSLKDYSNEPVHKPTDAGQF